MTAADVIQQTQHKMGVTVEKLRDDFTRIRTGRASTGLLDKIRVDYYGCPTPLNQVAQVGVGDAHTLTVQPWEKNMVKVCENAIRTWVLTRPLRATRFACRCLRLPRNAAANSPR